ncbi:MAG: hypothetical protein SNI20_05830 [Rikenellaceae bacterium]
MDVTNIIINISISVVAGGAAGFGLFRWLGKSLMQDWFTRNLKRFEHQLAILKFEYSSLYPKRVKAVEELYSTLLEIDSLKDGFSTVHINANLEGIDYYDAYASYSYKVLSKVQQFSKLATVSRIYFSKQEVEKITNLSVSLSKVLNTNEYSELKMDYCPPDIEEYMIKVGFGLIYSEENKKLTAEVEDVFRTLMGIKEDK